MDNMTLISTDIYGLNSNAKEIENLYCSCTDKCSLYSCGKCLNVRTFSRAGCKYGNVNLTRTTTKSKKYAEAHESPVYGKLAYPAKTYTAIISDNLWLNLSYVSVKKPSKDEIEEKHLRPDEWGYVLETDYGSAATLFMPLDDINIDLLAEILSYVPRTCFGGVIKEYGNEVVGNILSDLRKLVPELFARLVEKYPQFDVAPNYIGRKALIVTLAEGSVLTDNDNRFVLKDGKLYCDKFSPNKLPFGCQRNSAKGTVVIALTGSETYIVDDNSQVTGNTRFV